MRIVEDSPRYIRLRGQTIWFSLFCFVGALTVAGQIREDGSLTWLIPAGLSVAVGLFFLRWTVVTCDRALGSCTVSRRDIFRRSERQFSFRDISDIGIDLSRDSNGGSPLCRLVLTTTSGTIPLSASYEPDQERYARMREAMADAIFKGRAKPVLADPIPAMVRAGRRIDAIAALRQRDGLSLTEAHRRVEAMRREMAAGDRP